MLPESFTTKFFEFDIVEHTSGLKKELDDTPKTDSFMHLHLGIDGRSTTRLRYSTTRLGCSSDFRPCGGVRTSICATVPSSEALQKTCPSIA
jgi:hypothetical protein